MFFLFTIFFVLFNQISFLRIFKAFAAFHFVFFKRNIYGPFLWMGLNCLKTKEPLQGDKFTFYR